VSSVWKGVFSDVIVLEGRSGDVIVLEGHSGDVIVLKGHSGDVIVLKGLVSATSEKTNLTSSNVLIIRPNIPEIFSFKSIRDHKHRWVPEGLTCRPPEALGIEPVTLLSFRAAVVGLQSRRCERI